METSIEGCRNAGGARFPPSTVSRSMCVILCIFFGGCEGRGVWDSLYLCKRDPFFFLG